MNVVFVCFGEYKFLYRVYHGVKFLGPRLCMHSAMEGTVRVFQRTGTVLGFESSGLHILATLDKSSVIFT